MLLLALLALAVAAAASAGAAPARVPARRLATAADGAGVFTEMNATYVAELVELTPATTALVIPFLSAVAPSSLRWAPPPMHADAAAGVASAGDGGRLDSDRPGASG